MSVYSLETALEIASAFQYVEALKDTAIKSYPHPSFSGISTQNERANTIRSIKTDKLRTLRTNISGNTDINLIKKSGPLTEEEKFHNNEILETCYQQVGSIIAIELVEDILYDSFRADKHKRPIHIPIHPVHAVAEEALKLHITKISELTGNFHKQIEENQLDYSRTPELMYDSKRLIGSLGNIALIHHVVPNGSGSYFHVNTLDQLSLLPLAI